jgi:hypothetical protein
MAFNDADLHNILALIGFGFQKGAVTSQDHAKVLLILEDKVKAALTPTEEVADGNDVPSDSE